MGLHCCYCVHSLARSCWLSLLSLTLTVQSHLHVSLSIFISLSLSLCFSINMLHRLLSYLRCSGFVFILYISISLWLLCVFMYYFITKFISMSLSPYTFSLINSASIVLSLSISLFPVFLTLLFGFIPLFLFPSLFLSIPWTKDN